MFYGNNAKIIYHSYKEEWILYCGLTNTVDGLTSIISIEHLQDILDDMQKNYINNIFN